MPSHTKNPGESSQKTTRLDALPPKVAKHPASLELPTQDSPQFPTIKNPKKGNEETLRNERNRLRYFETKRIVLTREKKNYNQLIFMRATGDWVKAFSHSAVFFVEKIAPQIGSAAKLNNDRDYEVRSEVVVSIPDIKKLTEKLKQIGIELLEEKDGIYTFSLGYRIPPDEYNLMREQNQTIIERTGKMILPVVLMPDLLEDIKELFNTVFWEVRNMDGAVREMVGAPLVGSAKEMIIKYVKMSRNTESDVRAYLEDAMDDIESINGTYFVLDSLRIVSEKKMFEIAMEISKVRSQIVYEMKHQGMQDINKKYGGIIK